MVTELPSLKHVKKKRWMSKTHLVLTRNTRHLKGELSSLALQEASVQKTCEESVQCTKQMGIQTWKSLEDSNKCNFYQYRRTSWSIQCCCTVTWAERKDDGLDEHCLGILLLSLNCGLVFCKMLKYRSSSSGCYEDTKMTNTCAGPLFVGSDISQPVGGGQGVVRWSSPGLSRWFWCSKNSLRFPPNQTTGTVWRWAVYPSLAKVIPCINMYLFLQQKQYLEQQRKNPYLPYHQLSWP